MDRDLIKIIQWQLFYKTTERNGSSYAKIHSKSSAILNIENKDNYCLLWSILACVHPCKISNPNRVSNIRQYSKKINFLGFDFSNGFNYSYVQKFEKSNT